MRHAPPQSVGPGLLRRHVSVRDVLASSDTPSFCILYLNLHSYALLRAREELLSGCTGIVFDGGLLPRASGLLKLTERGLRPQSFDFSGVAEFVFQRAADFGWRVGLIGGKEGDATAAASAIQRVVPGVQVDLCMSGYRSDHEIVEALREARLDLVVLGVGAPRQDLLAVRLFRHLDVRVMTCGAFLSQIAALSSAQYYPDWAVRYGLRWLVRCVRDPKVIFRILVRYPLGLAWLIHDAFLLRLEGKS